jgi:hypothetical protein
LPGAFWLSYGLLWGVVVSLGLLVVVLYRQLGTQLVAEPAGRPAGDGLALGSPLPPVRLRRGDAQAPADLGAEADGRGMVLALTMRGCGPCDRLRADAGELPAAWPGVGWLWVQVGGGPAAAPPGWERAVAEDRSILTTLEAGSTPFAYALGPDGTVAARGPASDAGALASLAWRAFGPPADTPRAR